VAALTVQDVDGRVADVNVVAAAALHILDNTENLDVIV
jgi:hypothetical protein